MFTATDCKRAEGLSIVPGKKKTVCTTGLVLFFDGQPLLGLSNTKSLGDRTF